MSTKEGKPSISDIFNSCWIQNTIKTIAMIPSKGGCGNSCMVLNLAYSIASQNKKVLIMDANWRMPSLDIMTGKGSRQNVQHVIEGYMEVDQIIYQLSDNIGLISGSMDCDYWSNLSVKAYLELLKAASCLNENWEYLIIDCACSLSAEDLIYPFVSHENMMILNNEPASLSKAYCLIKNLNKQRTLKKINVLSNMTMNRQEGLEIFNKLSYLVAEYTDMQLEYIGDIPFSWDIRDAIKNQKPFVLEYPDSRATTCMKKLARVVESWPLEPKIASF